MAMTTILEKKHGYKLCQTDVTDEYMRPLRSTFTVIGPDERKLVQDFPTRDGAQALFNRVIADIESGG